VGKGCVKGGKGIGKEFERSKKPNLNRLEVEARVGNSIKGVDWPGSSFLIIVAKHGQAFPF